MTTAVTDAHTAAEYHAAITRAAVFQNPAGRLRLTGADARDLLNRLSTNLIDPHAAPGSVAVTVLTSDRGRIVDLVYVIHCGDHQLLLTSPGQPQNVAAFLDKYTIMEDLEVADVTGETALLTLTGPAAAAIAEAVADPNALVIKLPGDPDDPNGAPTYALLTPASDADALIRQLSAAGAVPISAATAETLRIARRQPAYGSEMGDAYNPLEAGLIGAIDFHKGCYIGQEVIARLDTYRKVQKYLVALAFDANPADANRLPGARLLNADGAVMGLVTSAAVVPGPTDAAPGLIDAGPLDPGLIGLGYVRTAAAQVGAAFQVAPDAAGRPGITARITAQPRWFGGEKAAPDR